MLALIAGTGALPAELVAQLDSPPLVCALQGFEPAGVAVDIRFRIETLGTLVAELMTRGVTELCMAGGVRRPPIDPAAIDAATLPLVPVLQQALMQGDDGALRALIGIVERAGIAVRAAHEIAPDLLPPPGVLTRSQPSDADRADAARGARIVAAMAAADVGQACAVARGQALAIEGVYGTDWMLASLAARPDPQGGGLLFKAPKAGQDRRVDLPAIGPGTVSGAAAAGLRGIVIEAGGVMVLERKATLLACDTAGLFLWVREPEA